MNLKLLFLPLVFTAVFVACKPANDHQSVNPLIGDISYTDAFGRQPDAATDEDLRIRTHLAFVEDRLRQKDVARLSSALRQQRARVLDLLHAYRLAGIFPRNYDYPDRRPCFIDRDGRICAVGYLVEQTAGRQVAEAINRRHQYDELLAMNDQTIDTWIACSGLTREECAMIQPQYGPVYTVSPNYIEPGYGFTSALLGGANLSLGLINGLQAAKGGGGSTSALIGVFTGAGQLVLGAAMYPNNDSYERNNESRKILSMVNIGLGTASFVISTYSLFTKTRPKPRRVSWNLYGYPAPDNSLGLAFSLTRKF